MNRVPPRSRHRTAFTLIEVLIVVAIVGILAALSVPMLQTMRKSAAESKLVAAMRQVLLADTQYGNENNGQIATLRYAGENLILNPGGRWVGNTFWGKLQPFLFPEITTTNQTQLQQAIHAQLGRLFGSGNPDRMTGTPLEGARIYRDTSGLPVPFAFNRYLMPWNSEVRLLSVHSPPSTILITYGRASFSETDAQAYAPMALEGQTPVNNIYYLPSKKAIAGFLDGRVEFLTPPIPDKNIRIDGSGT
jgi:prepilin-type N-terminal cleavage/methylation domain-containing protein